MENFAKKVYVEHDPIPTLSMFPSMEDASSDARIDDP